MSLCQYSNALGEPGKGIHSYRVFNIAIFDVLFTLLAAGASFFILVRLGLISNSIKSFIISLLTWFVAGIMLHRLFCVNTTINKFLFGIIS